MLANLWGGQLFSRVECWIACLCSRFDLGRLLLDQSDDMVDHFLVADMFVVDIAGHPTASFKDPGGLTVWTGSKSAPQQGINSTQILGPVITKDGKLVFFDLNQGNPVTLNYALHFNNGVPSVDPIIDNGGNNR